MLGGTKRKGLNPTRRQRNFCHQKEEMISLNLMSPLSGLGSKDQEPSSSTARKPLETKSMRIAKMKAICTKLSAEQKKLPSK